jgi:hypothetical protein
MSAQGSLQDDVTAVATFVVEQFTNKIRTNKVAGVREARWRRNQDYAVGHKLRSPNHWSGGRQLGIAGENTTPIVARRLPWPRLRSRAPWRSGCTLFDSGGCAAGIPTRIRRGRGGSTFQRCLLISSPVSLACVTSSKTLHGRHRRHIHNGVGAEALGVRTRDAPSASRCVSVGRHTRDAADQFKGGRSKWRYPVSVIQRARAR